MMSMNRSRYKLSVPILLILVVFVLLLAIFFVSYFSEGDRNHIYRISRVNPETSETHTGTKPVHYTLKPYEYISYEENNGEYVLISNFGEVQYGCTGTCFCEEDNFRRTASRIATKSVFRLLTAVTFLAALGEAERFFVDECVEEMETECPFHAIQSEIEECHEISESASDDAGVDEYFHKNTLIVHGNVNDVLQGKVSEENAKFIRSSELKLGLGAGTGEGLEDFGEAIMFDDHFFVKVANEEKGFETNRFDDGIRTSFLAALTPDAVPELTYSVVTPIPLQLLYEHLIELPVSSTGIIAVYGSGVFETIESTAIKTAPIFGEVLSENPAKYFHEREVKREIEGVFFGIICTDTDFTKAHHDLLFKRLIYRNFADVGGSENVMSHTHIAFENPSEMDVHHLLTQSVVKEAMIDIYPIHEVTSA